MLERYFGGSQVRGPVRMVTNTYIARTTAKRKSSLLPVALLALPVLGLAANWDSIRKFAANKLEESVNNYSIKSIGNQNYFVINNTLYPVVVRRLGDGSTGECDTMEECLNQLWGKRAGQDLLHAASDYTKKRTGMSIGKLQPGDRIYLPGNPFGGQ